MKFALAFSAVLAAGYCSPTQVRIVNPAIQCASTLPADLREFIDLIDQEAFVNYIVSYLSDPEMQVAIFYLFSDDFHNLYLDAAEIPELIDFVNFLESEGVDVARYTEFVRNYLGITTRTAMSAAKSETGGMKGFLQGLLNVIPYYDIRMLAYAKSESSEDFRRFSEWMKSDEFAVIVRTLRAHPEYQHIIATLRGWDVNVEAVARILQIIFGWQAV